MHEDELVSQYRSFGLALGDAVVAAVSSWLRGVFIARLGSDARLDERFDDVVTQLEAELEDRFRRLATADIDEPISGPLEQIRRATSGATNLLRDLDASPVVRDEAVVALYPEDVFGIGPTAAMELGQEVHDASIAWGAAKAYLHLHHHRD